MFVILQKLSTNPICFFLPLQVTVTLPMSNKEFTAAKQQSYILALADASRTSAARIFISKVTATRRRANSTVTNNGIQVEANIATSSSEAAVNLTTGLNAAVLNTQLAVQGLPAVSALDSRIISQSAPHDTPEPMVGVESTDKQLQILLGTTIGATVLILLLLFSWMRAAKNSEGSAEERELQRTLIALRSRLRITRRDGFVLSSEGPPLLWRWRGRRGSRRRSLGFVQKGHAEAAARLALFQDFDVYQFDGFCLSFEGERGSSESRMGSGEKHQYELLGDWLLELSSALIRPEVCIGEGHGGESGNKYPGVLSSVPVVCTLPIEKRFPYFIRHVCRARIWQDESGALFHRLQARTIY